ncbi:hypothetical protein E8E11_006268 [Didymella keratinophila]|nr:hypothetical protein E8E11_006268 [Didymella keratinophila]
MTPRPKPFKIVAEKTAKLEKTLKTNVVWPASLKQLVHEELSQYRETGEGDSYDSMSETQKGDIWVSRYTEEQARNCFYPLDKTIDVDYIITNEPWKSFARRVFGARLVVSLLESLKLIQRYSLPIYQMAWDDGRMDV